MNPLTRFPEAEQVLRQIEECAQQRSWPIVGPVKGRLLEALVQRQQPQHILEVGTMVGYSAILMARRLPPSAKLWTLEVSAGAAETASRNVQRAGLDNVITIVLGDALETLPSLSGPFDLVFLDGTKEQYLDYLRLVEAQIPAGGIVVADNAGMFAQ
ncbi:MAG: O-methyltransferase, partial [Chloroflexi bacterium]|nr:O-methyltransferase [Chloroflexota bacterium]